MEKTKILVVEDQGIIAKAIERTLRELGYSVPAIATSGEEAIQKALATRPDLVLMDIVLQGKMNGIEAAEQIYTLLEIPIIYLTAYADEATFERAKITEPFGYLLKPFHERDLRIAIEVALYKYRIEKKLKQNEQWLATTLRGISDGVIAAGMDGLVTFMNPVAEALTGWEGGKAAGKPLEEVFHVTHEENGRETEPPVQKAMRWKGKVWRTDQMLLVAKNGERSPVDFSVNPLRDDRGHGVGFVIAFRDITEQKKAERGLKGERDRLEMITQNLGAGVAVISRDYRIIWANRIATQDLHEKADGNPCYGFFHHRAEVCPGCAVKEVFEKKMNEVIREETRKDKQGEPSWVQIIATPIKDGKGDITAALELAVPITERKRAEDELRNTGEKLRALSISLQNVREEERTRIAREIHDELGQSLTALKMDVSWLARKLPKEQEPLLKKAESMSKLLDTTIQAVRKISSELRPPALDDLGLTAAMEWQVQEFQNRTGIQCRFISGEDDFPLDRDTSTAMFRIFQEALTNVARHANASRVDIHLQKQGGDLRLKVQDNGRGIADNQVADLKSLGLLGMRERASLFGGEIRITGSPQGGTIVTLRMPMKKN